MPTLSYGDDTLHYFAWGEAGRPVIFVHGSCGGGAQWKALATSLSDEFRCICPDNPGMGASGPWPSDRTWSFTDDEAALKALLDELSTPVHLVVHSGGGHFAYPLIRDRAADLLSIAMFEPVYFHLLWQAGDPLFAEPEGMVHRFRSFIDEGRTDDALKDFVDRWARRDGAWEGFPEAVKAMMRPGAARLYHEWQSAWFDHPDVDDLAAIDLPFTLFMGDQTIDSMKRVCSIMKQMIPDCRSVEIEGAGHMAPFTHAAIAQEPLRQHFARVN